MIKLEIYAQGKFSGVKHLVKEYGFFFCRNGIVGS